MKIRFYSVCFLLTAMAGVAAAAPAATGQQAGHGEAAVFAKVGAKTITWPEYEQAFATTARQKFYHGKPPEAEVAKLQREVGDRLINRILLLDEAKRRGTKPDTVAVAKQIEQYDNRYKDSPQWQANREQMLPGLRANLEEQSTLERLEAEVRKVSQPGDATVKAYYAKHPELFTEPEQVRVGLIMLKVDPSSPSAAWEQAREEADAIRKRLEKGADFAELARIHSGDASAKDGGDMGYLHRGMLPENVHVEVDKVQPGGLVGPVMLLEGVAVLKLTERKSARLRSYEDVKARAKDLWTKEAADKAWADFLAGLRKKAQVKVDESRFLPLAGDTQGATPAR